MPRRARTFLIVGVIVALSAISLVFNPVRLSLGFTSIERGGTGPLGLKLGLDLQGGSFLVYQSEIPNPSPEQMQGVVNTIERRVNAFGVSEPVVQRFGDDRIMVQLPGVEDIEEAKKLIGDTARLEYKKRECGDITTDPSCTTNYKDTEIGLTGEALTRAFSGVNPTSGEPIVNIQFNSRGASILADLTKEIANDPAKRIAIFLDDDLLMAPTADVILGGSGFIRGGFTFEEARTMAIQLESGRLPVPLKLIQESDVDAVLGADSLRASVMAGLVGLGLVLLFMLAYYRMAGLLAAVALVFYATIVLAIFKMLPVTLTLSGIAGLILSIGMAVDANVLIFERMKEELRTGRTLSSAIDVGFSRAWTSIRDSNVSTFITCGILFWFGTRIGTTLVLGFALTLFIGVAVSMFSAIIITKNLLQFASLTPAGKKAQLFTPEPLRRPAETAGGGN